METREQSPSLVLAGSQRLSGSLGHLGLLGAGGPSGLVYDASQSRPQTWTELDAELNEVFALTQRAVVDRAPIVYVVHEPSIWGHDEPLRAALATALLGGMRSAAVELTRTEVPANAVALTDDDELDKAARCVAFLLDGTLTGQLLTCGSAHLGRPAA